MNEIHKNKNPIFLLHYSKEAKNLVKFKIDTYKRG
jgi:hypothetical protein